MKERNSLFVLRKKKEFIVPLPFYLGLIFFFILGYVAIIFENLHNINKAATALLMAAGCWLIYFLSQMSLGLHPEMTHAEVGDIAEIIFFILAVMTIVQLIDSHQGFKIVTNVLHTSSLRRMLWYVLIISFFMSSVLDNLTSMIVMISLLRKLIPEKNQRWIFCSLVVIAVNAGGAWTPIGDVTTTMIWIGERITTWQTIKWLFLPSLVCMLVGGFFGMFLLPRHGKLQAVKNIAPMEPGARRVFFGGLIALIMIPIWKTLFNLPPFMGALIGLGMLWLITDLTHFRFREDRGHLRVPRVLGQIDTSGVLFFLGILLAVGALNTSGILRDFAKLLEQVLPNQNYVAIFIGLISSIVDNVPLVAATFGMYDLATYPTDLQLWQLIAYAAGTGGSILIIGSAAGVVLMGLEGVPFFWYFRRIAGIALIAYFAGLFIYFLQRYLVQVL
jgi:NhaD family Na+/H+ antiporter